jgi:hypothetical protein
MGRYYSGNGASHFMFPENKKSNKIESRRPYYGLKTGKYFGGDYRCNRIGRIMKPIGKIKNQGQPYNND